MGVSADLRIKLYNQQDEEKYEVRIGDSADALDSLLQTCGMGNITIRYTNVSIDRQSVLSEEDNKILFLNNSEEEMMETEIVDAKKALRVLDKLYWQIDLNSRKVQAKQQREISKMETTDEDRDLRTIKTNMEHNYFNYSYGKLLGILHTASELNFKVKIVGYYY